MYSSLSWYIKVETLAFKWQKFRAKSEKQLSFDVCLGYDFQTCVNSNTFKLFNETKNNRWFCFFFVFYYWCNLICNVLLRYKQSNVKCSYKILMVILYLLYYYKYEMVIFPSCWMIFRERLNEIIYNDDYNANLPA